jgi:hypothetical protein
MTAFRAMPRTSALLCSAMLVGNLAASAQDATPDPAAIEKLIDDFATLCTVAVFRPDDAMAGAMLRGYANSINAPVNKVMKAFAATSTNGQASLNVSIVEFSDFRTVICQMSSRTTMSIDDFKRLKERVEQTEGFGTMEGDIGTPKAPETGSAGSSRQLVFGNYKRPGHGPNIFLNVIANAGFTNLILTLAQPKPTN